MSGVRSCRKLEAACRDQIPYLWLTGWQHPGHNTLWRFYQRRHQGMKKLLKRTVRTAVSMELVDLAVQAADGTKLAANAAKDRSYTGEKLRQLLDWVGQAIEDLEVQNQGGDDGVAPLLPQRLTDRNVLRQRVRRAVEDLPGRERPSRTNLTDGDARLMKTAHGVVSGYNPQAMVSPLALDGAETGMPLTAVDLVDDTCDNGSPIPITEQAEENTGTKNAHALGWLRFFRWQRPVGMCTA